MCLVKGHAGKLLFGLLPSEEEKAVVLMLGRPQSVFFFSFLFFVFGLRFHKMFLRFAPF